MKRKIFKIVEVKESPASDSASINDSGKTQKKSIDWEALTKHEPDDGVFVGKQELENARKKIITAPEGGYMSNLIIKQIERRARLDHNGDISKAATQYFRDHPEELAALPERSK